MEENKQVFKKDSMIQSLQVGLSIIEVISNKKCSLKFTDILEETSITKSNLYKYLNTLTTLGLLYRSPTSGKYSLGPKLLEYGMGAINQDDNILEEITEFMEQIKEYCNETILFSRWTTKGPMVLKILSSSQFINIGAQIGTVLPINSATGKIFASYPGEFLDKWKQEQCKSMSEKELNDLEREIMLIKKHRVSFASEKLAPSVASISVPILNHEEHLFGAVTVVGFKGQIPQALQDPLTQYLTEKGIEISKMFGGK